MKTSRKGIVLKLNGKPFSVRRLPPTVKAIIAFLDHSPADELFRVEELGQLLHVSPHSIMLYGRVPELQPYRHGRRGTAVMWGNPLAIQELRRQIEALE